MTIINLNNKKDKRFRWNFLGQYNLIFEGKYNLISVVLISFGLHLWIFSAEGHGEMQEQKLRRRWKLASEHQGWMQEDPSPQLLQLCSSLYHTRLCPPSLYISWSMKSFWCVNCSICASLSVNESVSVQVSSCPIQKREDMNMCTCPITMSFCTTCSLLFFFFLFLVAQNAKAPCS